MHYTFGMMIFKESMLLINSFFKLFTIFKIGHISKNRFAGFNCISI